MEQRALGELSVGAVGLGCMGMSEFYGEGDDAESIRVIHRALDLGVTLIDTAAMYGFGRNEELVGRALASPEHRSRAVLATKFGIERDEHDPTRRGLDSSPEAVRRSCEDSLRRLGVDEIDLLYQHRVDPDVPIEETVGAMAELVRDGKVRALGLSEAGARTIERAAAVHPIAALQSEWSPWTRDLEGDVVGAARANGIGIVAYSPLGRGFLTGRFKDASSFGEGDFRGSQPRFADEALSANLELVQRVEAVAERRGCTPAQVALAWVLARGDDVVPIPGTKRVSRLEENAAATEVTLDDEDLAALDGLADDVVGERYADMSSVQR